MSMKEPIKQPNLYGNNSIFNLTNLDQPLGYQSNNDLRKNNSNNPLDDLDPEAAAKRKE